MDPRQPARAQAPVPLGRVVTPDGTPGAIAGATAAEFAQARFGGPTRVQSTTMTLTTAWVQVLPSNPRRVFWTVINRGVVNAAIDTELSSTFANGILLGAAGGYASMDVLEDGESVAWPLFGGTESGTAVLRLVEVMRV